MKRGWILFLLMSLFNKGYCSVEGNVANQSPSLLKSALKALAIQQIDRSLTKEPFVAYNKINEGTLELFGTAFGNEITKEMIDFWQEITSNFYIHSVILKWFYFDEKMLGIFDVFLKKLQKSVKSVTFERCYFPETFVYKGSLELNCVTKISFIQCFANEESFKEIFKVFKNSPVTSLTISRIFDYEQDESVDTNAALQRFNYLGIKKRLMKINDLKLDSFFPNIKFLSLSQCSLDFDHFSLTSLKNLNYVDLNHSCFSNLCVEKFFELLPTNLKHIKVSDSDNYKDLDFIESAFDLKVIIDNKYSFSYGEINCVKALSLYSSLEFEINQMNDKMAAIKDYGKNYGSVINAVTSVTFRMGFNYQSITNMLTLLTYFPNLDNAEVYFIDNCDASINDEQIQHLFSDQLKNVKKLSINFEQEEETSAFYCFIVELMKLCQKMTSLKFRYEKWHSFAINIKEIVERENIQFPNLNTLTVVYLSDNIDISIDLFYVAKYNIKNLTMDLNGSLENLDYFKCFPVDSLSIKPGCFNFENFIDKFITKFPHVTNFNWNADPNYLISTNILQHMKKLKNVTVSGAFEMKDFVIFLKFLPFDFESLEIVCLSS